MSSETTSVAAPTKYAIFQDGGKQYQAIEGQTVALEKIEGEVGDKVEFADVLLRKMDVDKVEIGTPFLEKKITAEIVRQMRGPKLIVFKFKRRKKYRTKQGHRQHITVVRIDKI
ncbi:50S ribosomal protein L21 [bacterium]|jgi:large subunit ribosomal protein L21|nr:50S ribosomal protein L21 [bacterium]MBT3903759.1 50S ribosomal protein L21 [bacterium]MBT4578255.1 50S ribosomal protein L21 [bacterium]MBT5345587.1 50S ribosomal protein L21 [bacterium]MBT6131054.1 50S ribosomal protein L21 [bacterium]